MAESTVSVRFSVQDAETVRVALEKLGVDGQKALDKLNTAGQKPSTGLKLVSSLVDELKSKMTGLAFSLGPLGTGLVALGPIGLAVAGTVGLIASAIEKANAMAQEMGERASHLHDFAQAIGLSAAQLQTFMNASASVGAGSDKVEGSLQRFSVQLDSLRDGSGALLDQLLKVNPAVAAEMANTRELSTELLLLAQAYAQAANKSALLTAAFGRNAVQMGPVLDMLAHAGGLTGLEKQFGGVIPSEETKRIADLKTQLDQLTQRAKDLEASFLTEALLERQVRAKNLLIDMLQAARQLADAVKDGRVDATQLAEEARVDAAARLARGARRNLSTPAASGAGPAESLQGYPRGEVQSAPLPSIDNPAVQAAALEKHITALGTAATAYDRLALTVAKLKALRADERISEDEYNRSLAAARTDAAVQMESQRVAVLGEAASVTDVVRLATTQLNQVRMRGVSLSRDEVATAIEAARVRKAGADLQIKLANDAATADELLAQRQAELNLLVREGKLSQDQANQSLSIYATKILPEVIRQQEQHRAALSGLKELEQTAGDLRGQLDTFATDTARNIGDAFTDIATGAKSGVDAFKSLEQQVIRSITNMIVQMTIIRPIAAGLQGMLGGFLLGGLGSSPLSLSPGLPLNGGLSPIHHSGYGPGDPFTEYRLSLFSAFQNAPRYHTGIGPGEHPAVIRNDESVLTPGQMRMLAPVNDSPPKVTVNVIGAPAGTTAKATVTQSGNDLQIDVALKQSIAEDIASGGELSQVLERQYGLDRTRGSY